MVWNVGTGKIINVFRINNAGTRDTNQRHDKLPGLQSPVLCDRFLRLVDERGRWWSVFQGTRVVIDCFV